MHLHRIVRLRFLVVIAHPMHLHRIVRLRFLVVIAHPMHLHQTTNFQLKEVKNMKNVLKLKCKNEIKATFSFRQGELWYFRLNEFETRAIENASQMRP
jgi:hypothetical protein